MVWCGVYGVRCAVRVLCRMGMPPTPPHPTPHTPTPGQTVHMLLSTPKLHSSLPLGKPSLHPFHPDVLRRPRPAPLPTSSASGSCRTRIRTLLVVQREGVPTTTGACWTRQTVPAPLHERLACRPPSPAPPPAGYMLRRPLPAGGCFFGASPWAMVCHWPSVPRVGVHGGH